MSRTRIKICGITRVEDILSCADAGVDAIGFVFVESSPRCVSIGRAAQLLTSVPPFIQTVGLFMNQSSEFVSSVLREVPLNLLQFHGDESPAECEMHGIPFIKAVPMGGASDPLKYASHYPKATGFLLDSHAPGESVVAAINLTGKKYQIWVNP